MKINVITPDELIDEYGKDNLIPITSLSQVKFYTTHGAQPLLVYPSKKADIMAFWYLKSKTTRRLYVDYRKYINDKYISGEDDGN